MLVAREEEGKRQDFPQGVGIVVIFEKDTMKTREGSVRLFKRGEESMTQEKYTLRPNENPKGIDLTYLNGPKKGQPWKRGIYFLGYGADLMICWGDEESRPTKFDTTDSKWVLNVVQPVAVAYGKPAPQTPPQKWKLRLYLDT